MGSEIHQWDQNGEKAEGMEDQDQSLKFGQKIANECVYENGEEYGGPVYEKELP